MNEPATNEQPPSAEAEAMANRWVRPHAYSCAQEIDALIAQRVSAETVRWQNRDRQRLEQIGRLQETVHERRIGVEQPTQETGQLGCDDHWRPGATAPKEHGAEIRIKIARARGVLAYWDAELQTFVLSRPVNVESVREPLGWQPLVPFAPASTGERPAPDGPQRCCDNGNFGDGHECQKQDGASPPSPSPRSRRY
jgi:hypothetical protein